MPKAYFSVAKVQMCPENWILQTNPWIAQIKRPIAQTTGDIPQTNDLFRKEAVRFRKQLANLLFSSNQKPAAGGWFTLLFVV